MSRDEYLKNITIGNLEPLNSEIVLEEYNPKWPGLYSREADKISSAIGTTALQIHHVGSTSVPGLCAKPIIDILLVVADSSNESSYVPELESAGYTLRIREPDWQQHRMMKGSGTDINLHVFSEYAAEIERMLAFRDWLRNHEDDRHKYEKVKRELARQIWQHIQHYADAKTGIIEDILGRALGTKMILETERLYLREMTQADFPLLCKHLQDADVMYAYEHAFSDAEVQEGIDKQFQRYEKDGFGVCLWR